MNSKNKDVITVYNHTLSQYVLQPQATALKHMTTLYDSLFN